MTSALRSSRCPRLGSEHATRHDAEGHVPAGAGRRDRRAVRARPHDRRDRRARCAAASRGSATTSPTCCASAIIRCSARASRTSTVPGRRRPSFGADTPARYFGYGIDESALRRVLVEPFRMGGSTAFVTRVFDPARDSWVEPKWITGPEDAILVIDGRFVLRERLAGAVGRAHRHRRRPGRPGRRPRLRRTRPARRRVGDHRPRRSSPPRTTAPRPSVTGGVIAWSCTWVASRGIRIVRPARRRAPARERAVRRAARPRARARPARG